MSAYPVLSEARRIERSETRKAKPWKFVRAKWRADCPDREPDLIYTTTDGYRSYRWNPERIEMLEHRYINDPGPGMHVHHVEHNTVDNRPEKLEALTPSQHRRRHRTVQDAQIVALWVAGRNCTEIGDGVGLDPSNVLRRLRALGIDTSRWAVLHKIDIADSEVLRRMDAGMNARQIAEELGVKAQWVRKVWKRNGRRGQSGRRPGERAA